VVERILITDTSASRSEVLVGRFAGAPDEEVLLPEREGRRRVAIVTHDGATRVAARIETRLATAGIEVATRQLPDREAAKTMATAEATYLWLNALGMTRLDTIVAVGGGALTDAAGFIAATYLRGIEIVLVPTTLLGAVDAAIGGKTAVNVGGKNLAGVFAHPARVVVDLDVVAGLPRGLLIEGTAETLKAGLIADLRLVELYEEHGLEAPLEEVVTRAVRVKAEVVSGDFREGGRRAILNYGHTVGHAVETAHGLPHGHAVAIGMVAAGAVAGNVTGFADADRQRDLIARLELPTRAPASDRAELLRLMALDKKRDASGIRMVLLRTIGDATVATVDTATVEAALDAVGVA
jgi:3-dehydroquinate synthase